MRPINLKVQGINSYVTEQEVKFDKLAESKLFGIFGETGSGKTTILDAIILALYGSAERESISNMVNVNVKTAHILFDFVENVNGVDVKYSVKRIYRVRESGVKQDAILTETKSGKVLADMPESVNEKVLEIIGVGKKEFLKCIALPQNEFDRFLIDTPANRKKTIAKLFNLEHFGVMLQEKIKNRKELTNLKLMNVNDKLALYNGVTQEAMYSAHITLQTKQKRLREIKKEITTVEKLFNQISLDYDYSNQLIDNMAQLTIKNNELNDINYLKRQVENTEKYGNIILFFNKRNTYLAELDKLNPELREDKRRLTKVSKKILDDIDELSNLQQSKRKLEFKLSDAQKVLDEYNVKVNMLNELQTQYADVNNEANNLQLQVAELTNKLNDFRKTYDEQVESRDRLNALLDENNKVLDKIKETKTVKTVDDFIDYLHYLKGLIKPDSLQEVYQYDVFEQVNSMILSMHEYELSKRSDLASIKRDYKALLKYGEDLGKLQSNLESKNKELNNTIAKIDNSLDKSNTLIVTTKTQIDERNNLRKTKLALAKNLNVKILATQVELKGYENINETIELNKQLEDLNTQMDTLSNEMAALTEEKNALVVSVEVASANVETISRELKDINDALDSLRINTTDTTIDARDHLTDTQLAEAKVRIAEYDKNIAMLNANIDELKSKIVNKNVTKQQVDETSNKLATLRNEENRISVDIGVLTNTLATLKDNLKKVKELNKEKAKIEDDYNTVTKLSGLITGGGLLEYVSEEYMSLITEFANKFVYQISKGKYLLRYNGEFYVLDNFNGGISRGVKTLSGGERFIISLSLALGISQSISVNNNRAFNFFFIDEGFGSLSGEYVESVLSSFNELIKLDFTVGFISHVDKMQDYINNRIIVTKPNNEVGTQIRQYF